MSSEVSDLIVLVPDRNMEAAISGLLCRSQALTTRPVTFRIYVHIERDPGCYHRAHDFLRPMTTRASHALVVFDREGSGHESDPVSDLEEEVTRRLAAAGWGDRAAAIAIDPELEVWVWSDSPHVDRCLGWEGEQPSLRAWLEEQGMWPPGEPKPQDPKLAVELALRRARKPRSSALYRQLADTVGLDRCSDPAFARLRALLRTWFPINQAY